MASKTNILAPAGSFDSLVAAVYSGADEVYLGVQSFNARARAANFSFSELKKAVGFCHGRNVRVNVTLNTILYDSELPDFIETVKRVAECGVDAVITQDLAAAKIIREAVPDIDLHGSTQMAIHSPRGAKLLYEMGYKRVILARELTLRQVKEITESCDIETEIFVHGALCMSLSGQCYASAFLGGRSGNRGRCAGTCRLPFSARGNADDSHLSLKDLCAMELLPAIQAMGVKCVKIEGRLRPPEYVAAAVDSCRKALRGDEFDRQLLQDVFSRSGFTNGFLDDEIDGDMFGVRTARDSRRTKVVTPQLRRLYRREMQKVPVNFDFKMGLESSVLTVSDGVNRFSYNIERQRQQGENDFEQPLKNSLSKLGGTPFYRDKIDCEIIPGRYIPLGLVNSARRELADKLLAARENVRPKEFLGFHFDSGKTRPKKPSLIARFENARQFSLKFADSFEYIIIPATQAEKLPEELKGKIVIDLGRDLFGKENRQKATVEKYKNLGFDKFFIGNTGQIPYVKGCRIFSDFTLNVSNSLSASIYSELGIENITISPEITLKQRATIESGAKTTVIGYGHIPLMMVKACPAHNVHGCKNCDGRPFLTDRKGKKFPIICRGAVAGHREIYNPVPLYMGDKKDEIFADFIMLRFTVESPRQTEKTVESFLSARPYHKDFTRGLYYKASI